MDVANLTLYKVKVKMDLFSSSSLSQPTPKQERRRQQNKRHKTTNFDNVNVVLTLLTDRLYLTNIQSQWRHLYAARTCSP